MRPDTEGGKLPELPPMLASYLKLICTDLKIPEQYPGSPVIMAKILKEDDRLHCYELHPREAEALNASMAEIRRDVKPSIKAHFEDGLQGLKSLLPPPSRRGLILIDPSWEEKDEYESIPLCVQSGLKRFPEGIFIVWYPLLGIAKTKAHDSKPIQDILFNLSEIKRCRLEHNIRSPVEAPTPAKANTEKGNSPRNMYGSGLVIYNPPWTLRSALEETMPLLVKALGEKGGSWRLDWESD